MDIDRLTEHANAYAAKLREQRTKMADDLAEREERKAFFRGYTADRLRDLAPDEFPAYMSRLWAMLVWGNKQYYIDKIIDSNGFDGIKRELADLVWGDSPLAERWDGFRARTKQIGPAMMSEILGHVHPDRCMVWNRRAYVGLDYLGVVDLPRYNHQVTGARYTSLCSVALDIGAALEQAGVAAPDLLAVDYFIWDELQVVDKLKDLHQPACSLLRRPILEVPPPRLEAEQMAAVHESVAQRGDDDVVAEEACSVVERRSRRGRPAQKYHPPPDSPEAEQAGDGWPVGIQIETARAYSASPRWAHQSGAR